MAQLSPGYTNPCPWCGSRVELYFATVGDTEPHQQRGRVCYYRCSDVMWCEYTGPVGQYADHARALHNRICSQIENSAVSVLKKENMRLRNLLLKNLCAYHDLGEENGPCTCRGKKGAK